MQKLRSTLLLFGIAEILLLILFGRWTDTGTVFIEIGATLALGVLILRVMAQRQMKARQAGGVQSPLDMTQALGLSATLSGFLLLIPGLMSDALGLLWLLPPVRKLVIRAMQKRIEKKLGGAQLEAMWRQVQEQAAQRQRGRVVEVDAEVVQPDESDEG